LYDFKDNSLTKAKTSNSSTELSFYRNFGPLTVYRSNKRPFILHTLDGIMGWYHSIDLPKHPLVHNLKFDGNKAMREIE
jgi:hypothetical protein